MKTIHHTALALALAAAFPALAQSNADVLRELQALKARWPNWRPNSRPRRPPSRSGA